MTYRYAGCDEAEDRDPSDRDLDLPAPTPWVTPFDQQCIHGGQSPHAPTRGVCPDEVCDWLGLPPMTEPDTIGSTNDGMTTGR